MKVDAADAGSGIGDVQLFVDGDYGDYSRSTSSPYQFTLPAGTLPLGTHKLKALVTDALGNQTYSTQTTLHAQGRPARHGDRLRRRAPARRTSSRARCR